MERHSNAWQLHLAILGMALVLTACGGGGGGSNSVSPVPNSYQGLLTPATLTGTSAQAIVSGAWNGGVIASDIGGAVPATASVEPRGGASSELFTLSTVLEGASVKAFVGGSATVRPATIQSDTLTGDCGGSASYTLNINDQTYAFSGQINFSSYCSEGMTVTGSTAISGVASSDLQTLTRLNMTFDSLNAVEGSSSWTLFDGSIALAMAADMSSGTDTYNYVLQNDALQKTYWVKNYVITLTHGTMNDSAKITGRYYDPDYGYVDITCPTTLTMPNSATTAKPENPTGGQLHFAGATSGALLTFNADQTTLLEVDINNDGTYEVNIQNPL